jgi:hypothetical protein
MQITRGIATVELACARGGAHWAGGVTILAAAGELSFTLFGAIKVIVFLHAAGELSFPLLEAIKVLLVGEESGSTLQKYFRVSDFLSQVWEGRREHVMYDASLF